MSSLDLAVVGNCAIAALVDRSAQIVWSCFPRLDGDPVFCALVDGEGAGGGVFAIRLDGQVSCEQFYVGNSAVLRSRLTSAGGDVLDVIDFAPKFERFERMFRPPMLIRRLVPVAGAPRLITEIRPRFAWGATAPDVTRGSHHVRYVGPGQTLRLTTDLPVAYVLEARPFALRRPASLILGPDESITTDIEATAREFLDRTVDWWRRWVRGLSIPFEWQDAVIRAAVTLKLCSFEETGGIVAALTSSIPEAADTQRNWDYRFCWLRDAYFVLQVLNRLGVTDTMEDYIAFVTDAADDAEDGVLKPLYGITRTSDLDERPAPTLAGYRGIGPVRVGNAAHTQVQNDVYGSVVLAAAHAFFDRRLDQSRATDLFLRLERIGRRAAAVFDQPDAGLWELRTRAAVHTFSAVMCWAACDRLARIAAHIGQRERALAWRKEADRLHDEISRRAWNAKLGSFTATFGGDDLDASLLLLHELDFLSADDPRFAGTVEAVGRALDRGGLFLRYDSEDDFGRPANAFVVCAFWYVDALHTLGRHEEARALFERLLALRNSFGLLSEHVDFTTGEPWGNFPQTYSMVGLLAAAMRLSKSWEQGI